MSTADPAPPYNPGFGVQPPVLAGRDELVGSILSALRAGPARPGFSRVLLGDRGVGKTVLLDAVGSEAGAWGWPVVTHQALEAQDLVGSLLARLPQEIDGRWARLGRSFRSLQKEIRVGLNVGVVKAEATLAPDPGAGRPPEDALELMATRIGRFARDHDSGVLVTLDEAQVIDTRRDLPALARVMQVVTNRRRLPVSVLLAGLPNLSDRILRAGATFFERCDQDRVGLLGIDATRLALLQPAAEQGVRFTADALKLLVAESQGYPFLIQLLGYETWKAAGPVPVIGVEQAAAGVASARSRYGDMLAPRWRRLSTIQRAYLLAMATHTGDGPVSTGEVARRLGRTHRQLSMTRQALIDEHHLVSPAEWGHVQFAVPGFRQWLLAGAGEQRSP